MAGEESDNDNDNEERRQAELEFVASAYNADEEAWHDVNATGDAVVHRLLPLKIGAGADQEIVAATFCLSLTLPSSYPSGSDPLQVTGRLCEEGSGTSSNTRFRKYALNALPQVVSIAQEVANESAGAEAVFSVLSRVEEWVSQDEWSDFYKAALKEEEAMHSFLHQTKHEAEETESTKATKVVFGRRLIYSHHIISKVKRADIKALASDHQLTGYMKIGWPGLLLIEGQEYDCIAFYDTIRRWNWQYLVVRGEEQDDLMVATSSTAETCVQNHRKFDQFQEVENMSIVAQHCRDVGLEALFRTSMKLYDNTVQESRETNSVGASIASAYGSLIRVDHMNDPKGYRKWLRQTAKETNCRLLVKQCYPCDDYSKRPEIVVAVVGSSSEEVSIYMKRWRTSRVDVDSKGKPCLERQMTVLFEGWLSSTASPEEIDWEKAMADDSVTTSAMQVDELLFQIGGEPWRQTGNGKA